MNTILPGHAGLTLALIGLGTSCKDLWMAGVDSIDEAHIHTICHSVVIRRIAEPFDQVSSRIWNMKIYNDELEMMY